MSTTIELPTATHGFRHSCNVGNAFKLWTWIRERGGVAVWRSVNLADLGASWSTPVRIECRNCNGRGEFPDHNQCVVCNGEKLVTADKPHWSAANEPVIIADPKEIGVVTDREVKRFRVGIRVSGNGLSLKCTDAASRRIRRELEKAGEGSSYHFEDGEAVITAPDGAVISLEAWANKEGLK